MHSGRKSLCSGVNFVKDLPGSLAKGLVIGWLPPKIFFSTPISCETSRSIVRAIARFWGITRMVLLNGSFHYWSCTTIYLLSFGSVQFDADPDKRGTSTDALFPSQKLQVLF